MDVDDNLGVKSSVKRIILEQELPRIDLGQHVLGNVVEILALIHYFPHLLEGAAEVFEAADVFPANPSHK